ncbi:MAG TPA: STAS domain-containing protein [Myxococcales bacterium]|nr:STAS domain-containing protein [Myxococcales bacterium]
MSVASDGPFLSRRAPGAAFVADWRRLEGVFDRAAAGDLGRCLPGLASGGELHLDFSRVSRVEDRGLAALAAELSGARMSDRVFFHGLSRHHVRLLAYFGVDAEPGRSLVLQ